MTTGQQDPAMQRQAESQIRQGRVGPLMQRWGLSGDWLVTAALNNRLAWRRAVVHCRGWCA